MQFYRAYTSATTVVLIRHFLYSTSTVDTMDNTGGSNAKMLIYLREVEEMAEDVLSDKQEIVDLDRKRHANREALSALNKQALGSWKGDQTKTWVSLNNCFIQLPNATATKMLKKGKTYMVTTVKPQFSGLQK